PASGVVPQPMAAMGKEPMLANDKKLDHLREVAQVTKQAAVDGPKGRPQNAPRFPATFQDGTSNTIRLPEEAAGKVNWNLAGQLAKEGKDVLNRRDQAFADDEMRFAGGRRARAGEKKTALPPPMVVREYAHMHPHGESNIRADFTETLLWQPVLV